MTGNRFRYLDFDMRELPRFTLVNNRLERVLE